MFAHLHSVHLVSIVTYQPGELDLPDLVELLNGEGRRPAAVLVPETIAEPEKSFVSLGLKTSDDFTRSKRLHRKTTVPNFKDNCRIT